VVKQGGKSWYFLTADYAFGHQLQADTTRVVEGQRRQDRGLGACAAERQRLLLVPAAGAGQQGRDPRPGQRRRRHHQLDQGRQRVRHHQDDEAGRPAGVHQRHPLAGPEDHPGHVPHDSWYWNRDAETRAWGRKFFDKVKRMPSSIQAGDYSATTQYLAAVKAVNSDDPEKVLAHMKKAKFNDIFMKNGYVRADGRVIHDMYLMQVKSPDKSTEPWDYYDVKQVFKGEEAWTTKAESKCPLWK
jgi:branched-chain amino acid transport system substrate-binding protein